MHDLVHIDEKQLHAQALTALARAALLLMRNARRRTAAELEEDLLRWLDTFAEVYRAPHGLAALVTLMKYAMLVSDIGPQEAAEFARRLGKGAEEAIVTAGEQLIAQGKLEGKLEGEAAVVLKLLTLKFGPLSESTDSRVRTATLEELDAFAERILTATTLEDVLG